MKPHPIVVGADGTEHSKTAVRWAAREAHRRGLPLRVTHVFDWEWHEARYDMSNSYFDEARKHAEGVTATAVYEARGAALEVDVEGDPLVGHAAARLLSEADDAELMVLGSRGRGGFASLLLGSVSQRVATHAGCSVVVVRGRGGDLTEGPVAVGLDESQTAEKVLEVAFAEASGRGSRLSVIRGRAPVGYVNGDVELPEPSAEERARVEAQLTPWRGKFPDVPIDVVLVHDGAAAALVDASTRAQLVVVGSRGRGTITGAVLGSVGLQLLHHADCPVYIVR
ncbi:universal stress protein [Paractinoplanes atraurantiacus]|uniref:Nucleotide-binding universal stress protein, UspA family n=1 Tax=Paractinoplanes atraurantiacus TaxID=1036182 RepID=A0A285JJ88_9ACTN|nr:universal stress protein [Actinoplanes atraurantiacus]SNY59161.1 Nucleotide-binding universal stress protein, UspA family [Actinoplanes atraurantiacus]